MRARVSFDGRIVGETPMTLSDVSPGEHRVDITIDGDAYQPWSSSVLVTAGEAQKVLVVMTPTERAR